MRLGTNSIQFVRILGCVVAVALQHIHPDEQILLKQNVLKSHLQHFAGLQPEQWLDPIRSEKIDYRRRARVGVRYIAKQNRLVMGFVRTPRQSFNTDSALSCC